MMPDPSMMMVLGAGKPELTPVTDDEGNGVNVSLPDFGSKAQPGGTYEATVRFKYVSRDGAPEGETPNSSDQDAPSEGAMCEVEILAVGEPRKVKDQRPMSFPRSDEDEMMETLNKVKSEGEEDVESGNYD